MQSEKAEPSLGENFTALDHVKFRILILELMKRYKNFKDTRSSKNFISKILKVQSLWQIINIYIYKTGRKQLEI